MNSILKMKSVNKDNSETTETELATECSFELQNGKFVVVYKESSATGFEGSDTTLTFDGDRFVSIERKGTYNSSLLLEIGKKHFCHYGTPYGSITVGINAIEIKNELSESGGKAYARYSIDMNSCYISENEIFFEIETN